MISKVKILLMIFLFVLISFQLVQGENVQEYIEKLDDSDSMVRYRAIESLKEMGSEAEEAIPALKNIFLRDNSLYVDAAAALVSIGEKSIPVFIEGLESETAGVRKHAARNLGKFGAESEDAVPKLIDLLYSDSNQQVRIAAATTLGEIGPGAEEALPALAVALGDDFQVSRKARMAIDQINSEADIIESLLSGLEHEDLEVRKRAVKALEEYAEEAEEAVPDLIRILNEDNNKELIKEALNTLEAIGARAEEALSSVKELIFTDDVIIRRRAIRAIKSIDPEYDLIGEMIEIINDDDEKKVENALWVLEEEAEMTRGKISDLLDIFEKRIIDIANWRLVWKFAEVFEKNEADIDHPAFLVLKKEDTQTREEALQKLTEKEAKGALLAAAGVEEESIQKKSIQNLLKLIPEEELRTQIINQVMQTEDDTMLKKLTEVLFALGLEKEESLPALISLLNFDQEIATRASKLIKKITDSEDIRPVVISALNSEKEEERKAADKYLEDKAPFWSSFEHSKIETEIGQPALAEAGMEYPHIEVYSAEDGLLEVELLLNKEDTIYSLEEEVQRGERKEIKFDGELKKPGTYKISITLNKEEEVFHDNYYFHLKDEVSDVEENMSEIVYINQEEQLVYVPDYRGNRIPNFSGVGYKKGEEEIPEVPVEITLEPSGEDDTEKIQSAIDEIAAVSPDENGFRGTILLKEGIYEVSSTLDINSGGIVIRGEGQGEIKQETPAPPGEKEELRKELEEDGGTIILSLGSIDPLFNIQGESKTELKETVQPINENYVPVGAREFLVKDTEEFEVGDKIIVTRQGNQDWISEIGMDEIPPRADGGKIKQWKPFSLLFDREIKRIDGNQIVVDVPLVNAIEQKWGGGEIYKYEENRSSQIGIENLRAISVWAPEEGIDQENHAGVFVKLDNIKNSWIKDITTEHFIYFSIDIARGAKWITVDNCQFLLAQDRYYDGYVARYGAYINGQQSLVKNSYAINNRHAYGVSAWVPGPNVFYNNLAEKSLNNSEPHHRWSTGGLFDNVEDRIAFQDRLNYGSGHGWAGANYVAWNTRGVLTVQKPPTAQNWSIGHVGRRDEGSHVSKKPEIEQGYWESFGEHVYPESLYLYQSQKK